MTSTFLPVPGIASAVPGFFVGMNLVNIVLVPARTVDSPYSTEWARAIEKSVQEDLVCGGTAEAEQQSLDAGVPSYAEATRFVSTVPTAPEARIGDCVGVHFGALVHWAMTMTGERPVLTAGDVEVLGRPRYRLTRQILRSLLRRGDRDLGRLQLHMWLTFGRNVVLDLCLGAVLQNEGATVQMPLLPDGMTIFGEADGMVPHLRYRPHLVGEAFAFHIGALGDRHYPGLMFLEGRRRGQI